ncbi:hypothetical protein B1A99_10745 [Cohnella sp. CIP 111063]|uniref:hypothetical protein n=1 Tax=unclassified Cohnella TaxID=2636738 RepID=UPI000B8BE28E|nr:MULTISPECIES: hypothetical protein [unclassified Cohnella]OXS59994.1 hypothetical protein B1A99_10745 [Cohnella sp. CIP 111063]PRX72810.1 hypothetical protein B0G52_105366 [Cohnella sp. SGD-V74]
MLLAIIMGVALAGSLIEYRFLARRKQKRDLIVDAALLAVGLTLGALSLSDIDLPSPLTFVEQLFGPTSRMVAKLLS